MFDDIYTLINQLPDSVDALRVRVGQLVNLCNIETANASRRWIELQALNSELATKNARIAELEEQVEEIENVRKAWWPVLREELAKPAYSELVTAKNAVGVLDKLREVTQTVEVDPIPIDVLKADFAGLSLTLALKTLPIEVKGKWGELVKQLLQLIQGVQTVSRATVAPIALAAIADGILDADYRFGIAKVSRLKQLNLEGRLTSALDITEAMGW